MQEHNKRKLSFLLFTFFVYNLKLNTSKTWKEKYVYVFHHNTIESNIKICTPNCLPHQNSVRPVMADNHTALFSCTMNIDSFCLHKMVTEVLPSVMVKQHVFQHISDNKFHQHQVRYLEFISFSYLFSRCFPCTLFFSVSFSTDNTYFITTHT